MQLSNITNALKAVFNNPGKSFAVIFTVVLALKTFVIPTEGEMPGPDMDLQGIATPHAETGSMIKSIDHPEK